MDHLFCVGQLVTLRADPSRRGAVTELLVGPMGMPRYRVFHSASEIREYDEDQLVAQVATPASDSLLNALVARQWLDPAVFRSRLTATRLGHPQTDNLYALRAARIEFVPFQLKPLLRLLRADRPRLLIADEVGVGKTIEAGLILKELETRQHIDSILIVCPKALVSKWRAEMRRFDEQFSILGADALRYCLREAHLDGAWPSQYRRAIVHLELLRIDEHLSGTTGRRGRPGLLTLEPPPHFALTIVDEAHHLRNPETNSYRLARFLCDVSETVLFLSATPVHLGSENLYALLNLLRPDMFPDGDVFQEVLEPNRHIMEAMRQIRFRAEAEWQERASVNLRRAAATSWGRRVLSRDPRFSQCQRSLEQPRALTDEERVHCLRDLEEVHSLAHVMNRTRRRDIGRFTLREPHTVSAPFTREQQELYESLIRFRREVLLLEYDARVVRLITDTLERQAASCLLALLPMLDSFLRTGRFTMDAISDDPDVAEDAALLPQGLLGEARQLREMAAHLPPTDPKLDHLLEIVRATMDSNGPRKVLVFSFFLHTLSYLLLHLRNAGYRVALITGRVEDEERERLRERFRLPHEHEDALDVLLSSEVGCEGLDYEFCDRLVNYDIPWNPMRIEQRIGRIDRFGQTAEKILIFNFVTPGTVEERIFFRCFDRLGIFRETVGDLEDVLSDDFLQDLSRVARDPTLSPVQAEEKARQMADNAIRLVEERRRLEEEGGGLLGLDEAFMEDIDTLLSEGRYVSADDLRQMIEGFLAQPELSGRMWPDEHAPGVFRLRLRREARDSLLPKVRELPGQDRAVAELARWLSGADPYLAVTFDQQVALERRDLPFVTPVHPLSRLAVAHWLAQSGPLASHLRVSDGGLAAGQYAFLLELWETIAIKPELRLMGFAWDVAAHSPAPQTSDALVRLIGQARGPAEPISLSASDVTRALQKLDEQSHEARSRALADLRERNEWLAAQRLASLDAHYHSRMDRVNGEIRAATDERISRMKLSERARIEADYSHAREAIEEHRACDIVTQRVAAGVLEVRHAQ